MQGQEHSVSYQAEERYWTDYLRIALPIAGLLLLLGVFWYWASTFIGDEDDNDPQTPVAAQINTPVTAPTFTATTAEAPAPTEEAAAQPTEAAAPEEGEDGGETTDPGGETTAFAEGDIVVVNDNDVNLRAEATTESEALTTLVLGQELRIISSTPVDDGTYVWWNVADEINSLEGWIAGEFIDYPE
jgi:Bacterial SH3 domain